MTLFDTFNRPLEILRISLTDRCNFRCSYCMPADAFPRDYHFIPAEDLLTFDEITRLVEIFGELGVHKVRLTGGEPLLRPHIERLVKGLTAISSIRDIAMTTNGYLLPQQARLLHDAGLLRLNISLDSLDDTVFRRMNGDRASVHHVLKGIEAAEKAGFSSIKINVVVQQGINDHTLLDLALYFRQRGHIVRFIEFVDAGTLNDWQHTYVMSMPQLIAQIKDIAPLIPLPSQYHGEVVKRYSYADGSGEIGFITSVTHPFCSNCNRLRVSAEGKLYTCLFASQGFDIRKLLRTGLSDNEIVNYINEIWTQRKDRYSDERTTEAHVEKVEMYRIGG